MHYTEDEVIQYVREEDVKFIRLSFCDVFGRQKNIAIMPDELERAFSQGIAFDASAIAGFGDEAHSDLFLHPEPSSLIPLPWRPEHGKVVRMISSISYPDGTPHESDTRRLLIESARKAEADGLRFYFGSEEEFYLFRLDSDGNPTAVPHDQAGYMDLAPDDAGENVRREVCLMLDSIGIHPESSHHEEGPGQNEIDFRYSDPVQAADNALVFQTIVKIIAKRNGLYADFSPKPIADKAGNGLHVNISVKADDGSDNLGYVIAGLLEFAPDMTLFMNPVSASYSRLGNHKAPTYISWSEGNRSQLIRVPAAEGEYRRAELRSPDPLSNPYIAFSLMIEASLHGIRNRLPLPSPSDFNIYKAENSNLKGLRRLPLSISEACRIASESDFVKEHIPSQILAAYMER